MFYTSEKVEDATSSGTIEVVDELVSFAWSVDWSLCKAKNCGEFVLSPSFSTLSDDGQIVDWKFQLYPDGSSRKCRGSMSLYLYTQKGMQRGFLQKIVYFHLLNNRNEEINKVYGELFSQSNRDTRGVDQFIRRDLFEHNAADLLKYGKLTVVCTMADVKSEAKLHSAWGFAPPVPPKPAPRRAQSLGDLTETGPEETTEPPPPSDQFEAMLVSGRSDVSIVAGARSFCAHRAILAARSSYFRSTFEQDVVQGKSVSFVDVGELAGDVVVELLRYLYLDRVERLEERASVILAPANKYKLEKLKARCEEVMIKELNVGNASEYLVLSFLHEADKLRAKAMDFAVSHSLDVADSAGFKAAVGSHAKVIGAFLKAVTIQGKNK